MFKLQGNKHIKHEIIPRSEKRCSQRHVPSRARTEAWVPEATWEQCPLGAGDRTGEVCQGPAPVWTAARTPGRPQSGCGGKPHLPPQPSAGQPRSEAWRAQASGKGRAADSTHRHQVPGRFRHFPRELAQLANWQLEGRELKDVTLGIIQSLYAFFTLPQPNDSHK